MMSAKNRDQSGYSLIELIMVVAIIVTLGSMGVPIYIKAIDSAKNVKAIGDIKYIQTEIEVYQARNQTLPATLKEIDCKIVTDPWGRPYVYSKISSSKRSYNSCRKDKNLVPLNNDYDLYSKGKDGLSQAPLTSKQSRDDIVRASNGGFIGLASNY